MARPRGLPAGVGPYPLPESSTLQEQAASGSSPLPRCGGARASGSRPEMVGGGGSVTIHGTWAGWEEVYVTQAVIDTCVTSNITNLPPLTKPNQPSPQQTLSLESICPSYC